MKKRFLLLLSFLLLIQPTFATSPFHDLSSNHWAYDHILYLSNEGVINGFEDGSFKAEDTVNVDQFLAMSLRAFGDETQNAESGYWAQTYIDRALELGLMERNTFSSYTRPITREEMALISVELAIRSTDKPFFDASLDTDKMKTKRFERGKKDLYTDAVLPESMKLQRKHDTLDKITPRYIINDIKDFEKVTYEDYVVASYQIGLITGYPDGRFDPKGKATRAEATTIIRRNMQDHLRRPYENPYLRVVMSPVSGYFNRWTEDELLNDAELPEGADFRHYYSKDVEHPFMTPLLEGKTYSEIVTFLELFESFGFVDGPHGYWEFSSDPHIGAIGSHAWHNKSVLDAVNNAQVSREERSILYAQSLEMGISLNFRDNVGSHDYIRDPEFIYAMGMQKKSNVAHDLGFANYYDYFNAYYADIYRTFVDFLFEDDADKVWAIFTKGIQSTSGKSIIERGNYNGRNFYIVYSANSTSMQFGAKHD